MAKPVCINIRICPTTNVLISDNLPVRESYFDSNIIARILRCFFLWTILKWTSIEAPVYMRCHQDAKVERFDISNVIYHKFSHNAVSYTLNGENVNLMLESFIILKITPYLDLCFSCAHYESYKYMYTAL